MCVRARYAARRKPTGRPWRGRPRGGRRPTRVFGGPGHVDCGQSDSAGMQQLSGAQGRPVFSPSVQMGRSVSLGKAARQPQIRARPAATNARPTAAAVAPSPSSREAVFSVTKHKTHAMCSAPAPTVSVHWPAVRAAAARSPRRRRLTQRIFTADNGLPLIRKRERQPPVPLSPAAGGPFPSAAGSLSL